MSDCHCCIRVGRQEADKVYHAALKQGLAIQRLQDKSAARPVWLRSTTYADAVIEAGSALQKLGPSSMFCKLEKGKLSYGLGVPLQQIDGIKRALHQDVAGRFVVRGTRRAWTGADLEAILVDQGWDDVQA
eukprot:4706320-Amphidinium_carterae.1